MSRLLFWLAGFLPLRVIAINQVSYIERYYVGTLFGTVFYLHRYLSADGERHTHNHPWGWGASFVLLGHYLEEIVIDFCHRLPGGVLSETVKVRWFNRVDGNKFHRIASVKPGTWTLFFHGPRVMVPVEGGQAPKSWGFLEQDGRTTLYRANPYPETDTKWWLTAPVGRFHENRTPQASGAHRPSR